MVSEPGAYLESVVTWGHHGVVMLMLTLVRRLPLYILFNWFCFNTCKEQILPYTCLTLSWTKVGHL